MSDVLPDDWKNPEWNKPDQVHNWRNYANVNLQNLWHSLTDEQKQAIASSINFTAGIEEWD